MEDSGWDWGTVPQWLTLIVIAGFGICITLWLANVVDEVKDLSRAIANLSKAAASRKSDA